ncbi:nuclear autoantigenic sperm protein isoform X2 [Oryzias melastigma]|uniref:nuclear autoantigenic sperm protein isoform X2 n=1 Tax=Oryzias melastigma TaxID=30732 RepID=UPI000CF826B6|nr:nuclear autoantigenic sperm protein isoform X2 [Oryzias melastigma]
MPEETSTASGSSSAEEKPCSSSAAAAADSSVDVMEEAKKLIGTGKRHLVMGDVVSAVNVFQDACSVLASKYGDTADECGEAVFLYGKSLLELARMENGVLGNALEGVPEESEEEEQPSNSNVESADNLDEKTRDELRKQVYDAMAEEAKSEEKLVSEDDITQVKEEAVVKTEEEEEESPLAQEELIGKEAVQGSGEGEKNDEPDDAKKEESDVEEEQSKDEPEDDDDDDDDDDEDDDGEKNGQENEEDDVGNLQLAWEMLEVAKLIYKRKEGKDDQLMAAQAHLKLGEVGAETGNYPQALEDFQECLSIQLRHLPPHSRLLAETHYHVATTLCYMDEYRQAIQHYNSSIEVIENRLSKPHFKRINVFLCAVDGFNLGSLCAAMLQKVIDAAEGDDGAAEEKSELEELKQLLPEIREKVEDAKESLRTASAASQAIQQTLGGTSSSSTFLCENGGPSSSTAAFAESSQDPGKCDSSSSSKAASDISHLVRKKRKPEEENPVKDTDAKQAKQEASVNGSGDSSSSNGVQEEKSQEAPTQSASVESSA